MLLEEMHEKWHGKPLMHGWSSVNMCSSMTVGKIMKFYISQ